ncbi:regulatory protein RecX [Microbacterium sp. GXF7504]
MVRFVEDDEDEQPGETPALAPVIPLFGADRAARDGGRADSRHDGAPTSSVPDRDGPRARQRVRADGDAATPAEPDADAAAEALLRKLASRSLSVIEARGVLERLELDRSAADAIIARYEELGYLDDHALAEHLVDVASRRKGQGRRAIARSLTQRGVPREVTDAVLAQLPDDDEERAIEFARTKARAMRGLDPQVALRRLVGQLSRRGYPGNVAMSAARAALDGGEDD